MTRVEGEAARESIVQEASPEVVAEGDYGFHPVFVVGEARHF